MTDADCPLCGGIVREAIPDPIDAFLASPQAAEELARALHRAGFGCNIPRWCEDRHNRSAAAILAAWQKVRIPEEAG